MRIEPSDDRRSIACCSFSLWSIARKGKVPARGKALTALRRICSMEHSTLNLFNDVYTKWVPRPLTAIIIVSISEGRHIDLRSSTIDHRLSIFDHRSSTIDLRSSTFGHRSSKVDTSIFDHRSSTIDLRPSTIDLRIDVRPSIFDHRSSTIDLRTSIFEHRSSKIVGGNIAPTIQHRTDNSSPTIYGAPLWTILGDELSVRCWIVGAMFPPTIFEDRCSKIDGRRSMVDGRRSMRRSMVDGRWSKVDGRRSKIDVSTFEDRWPKVDDRRSMVEDRKSMIDGR